MRWILAVAAVVAATWLIYGTRAVRTDRFDQAYPPPDTCQVQHCLAPATHKYDRHPSGMVLYICSEHAGEATRAVHDGSDFALWESE